MNQFDNRYHLGPCHSEDAAARKRARFVAGQQLELQAAISHRPANIAWFERRMDSAAVPADRPLVGYFCNMVPTELIRAAGARPVRLDCGNAALVQPGEELLSGEICPVAKSSFGAFLDRESLASRCDALIVAASCDAKRKLGEVLSDFKPTFTLNLPAEQDAARYGKAAQAEMERLAEFLSERFGAIRRGALLEEIEAGRSRTALVRRFQEARAANPEALSIRDFYLILQSATLGAEPAEWRREAEAALGEVEAFRPGRRRNRARMVLTGAPILWPNFKPLNLIEESGADVVADTLCTGAQSFFDPVVMDEKSRGALMRALAQRYLFASPCPCFISQGTRLSRVLELVEQFRADGVIHYGLRLCQLFDMETYRLSRVLKSRRIPFMALRTDYSLEDTEQLRVRLEAFLETVGAAE